MSKRKREIIVTPREFRQFCTGLVSTDLLDKIDDKRVTMTLETDRLRMTKRILRYVQHGQHLGWRQDWILSRLWTYLQTNVHPILAMPNRFEFFPCENKTKEPAYHCQVCKVGPETYNYGQTATICANSVECFRRLTDRLYSNIVLMISMKNSAVNWV